MTRQTPHLLRSALFLGLALLGAACTPDDPRATDLEPEGTVVVDSVFPMDEELRRFRMGMDSIDAFRGGVNSRDELVETFVDALSRADTLALAGLAMTPTEFAWLYFPNSMYTEPPYQLPPGMVWFQLQNRSSRGLNRALSRLGGQTLYYTGYQCPDEGQAYGEGWIWHGCTLLGQLPTGEDVEQQLFGSILEWRGRYRLVSFSNEL